MVQFRLTFWHSALAASGSDVIHRFEDCVSGQMMPTFAPLPSIAPAAAELEVAGVLVLELLFLLEEQALSTSEAATPATTRPIALLRMGCTAFRGTWDRVDSRPDRPRNVVRVNLYVPAMPSTTSKPFRYSHGASPTILTKGSQQRPQDVLHDAAVPVVLGLTGRVNTHPRLEPGAVGADLHGGGRDAVV